MIDFAPKQKEHEQFEEKMIQKHPSLGNEI